MESFSAISPTRFAAIGIYANANKRTLNKLCISFVLIGFALCLHARGRILTMPISKVKATLLFILLLTYMRTKDKTCSLKTMQTFLKSFKDATKFDLTICSQSLKTSKVELSRNRLTPMKRKYFQFSKVENFNVDFFLSHCCC